MRTWALLKNSEGKGALGCLFSLLLLGFGALVVIQVGPPYFAFKSMETDVSTEVSRAGAHFYSNEMLLQNILDVAKKNEIKLNKQDIKIERYAGQIQVQIEYQVPTDLYVIQHTFNFKIKASSYVGSL